MPVHGSGRVGERLAIVIDASPLLDAEIRKPPKILIPATGI
jgi:hypothetical protein